MTFKEVFRYDHRHGIFRLFRVIWKHGEGAGYGAPDNYHGAFKVALSRKPFFIKWKDEDRVVTFCWLRLTFQKSFGGIPA